MKQFLTASTVLLLLAASVETAAAQAGRREQARGRQPFAVIEYFTSENCLTCRANHNAVRELLEDSRREDGELLVLSYHVEYLHSTDWEDPYSRPAHLERQQKYASAFAVGHAVPGTMIVNGVRYVKGSTPYLLERTVKEALAKRPPAELELAARWRDKGKSAVLGYYMKGRPRIQRDYFNLHIAVVESAVSREIRSGANAGHTFEHTNVVRSMETHRMQPKARGVYDVILPAQLPLQNSSIVVFVQDPVNNEIAAAARLAVADISEIKK